MLQLYEGNDPQLVQVGIDEAGRGCFAGPVVAAAVCWDSDWLINNKQTYEEIDMINDSKKLSLKKRQKCFDFIKEYSKDYGISFVSNKEIDEINILQATYKAMHNALDDITCPIEKILVDGNSFKPYMNRNQDIYVPHLCVTNGDNTYLNIASASILAKISRDKYIEDLCLLEPIYQTQYDWKNNKCYGTPNHLEGIKAYGITDLHRKTYGICKRYV